MEKNDDQLSGILDPASAVADIEMEKNDQLSGILDPASSASSGILEVADGILEVAITQACYVEPKTSKSPTKKNNVIASSSIDIKQLEKLLGDENKLKDVRVPVRQFCIYKVPKYLRKINEEAYTPQVISIGPLHHGNEALVEMEEQKLIYILEFQKREGAAEKLKEFKKIIEDKVQLIRDCYQENSRLSNPDFVNMILLDAVFIFQFFLKNEEQESDFFLGTTCVKAAITRDLQLLENQLPYFLLKKLFKKVSQLFVEGDFRDLIEKLKKKYPDRDLDPFLILCHRFFFNSEIAVLPEPHDQIQHFIDLRRYFLLMDSLLPYQRQGEHVRDLPIATKLHASGVKFKKQEIEGRSPLEITFEFIPRAERIPFFKSCQLPIPFFKTPELRIPRLEIDEWSECLYRNLMALELCHYPPETHICNFFLLMDFLINTEKDVDLFVEEEIIFSLLGDNAKVAKMFNNLCLQITPSPSVYYDIGKKLKAHYAKPWNRTMATFFTVYFGDIWAGTATVAAFVLLVLTFIQAVYSIR